MAYLRTDKDIEDQEFSPQRNALAQAGGTLGGGGATTRTPTRSGSWTNLQRYVEANKPQVAQQVQDMAMQGDKSKYGETIQRYQGMQDKISEAGQAAGQVRDLYQNYMQGRPFEMPSQTALNEMSMNMNTLRAEAPDYGNVYQTAMDQAGQYGQGVQQGLQEQATGSGLSAGQQALNSLLLGSSQEYQGLQDYPQMVQQQLTSPEEAYGEYQQGQTAFQDVESDISERIKFNPSNFENVPELRQLAGVYGWSQHPVTGQWRQDVPGQ